MAQFDYFCFNFCPVPSYYIFYAYVVLFPGYFFYSCFLINAFEIIYFPLLIALGILHKFVISILISSLVQLLIRVYYIFKSSTCIEKFNHPSIIF